MQKFVSLCVCQYVCYSITLKQLKGYRDEILNRGRLWSGITYYIYTHKDIGGRNWSDVVPLFCYIWRVHYRAPIYDPIYDDFCPTVPIFHY